MESFKIYGNNRLFGKVVVTTSKNATLPILAGCILSEGIVKINKFPKYSDTLVLLDILKSLGAEVLFENDCVVINCKTIDKWNIEEGFANKIRASIFCLGPLVARFKKARTFASGGCNIGARPIDLHIKGLKDLGVEIIEKHGVISCDAKNQTSGNISLAFPSVGATENLIMASVLSKGKTVITGCAKECEIVDLCNFLNCLGAKICGHGTDVVCIEGVERLGGGEYTPMGDRIIAGTYIVACAMCGGQIEIENTKLCHIANIVNKIPKSSCQITEKNDRIVVSSNKDLECIEKLETMPYPGFPTDMQPQFVSMLSVANGTSIVKENLFDGRFKFVQQLKKMGANIDVQNNVAIVKGTNKLFGATVEAEDLRGGAALVLAGLVAEGYTTVKNVCHIDRGYYELEKHLRHLGAKIERIVTE